MSKKQEPDWEALRAGKPWMVVAMLPRKATGWHYNGPPKKRYVHFTRLKRTAETIARRVHGNVFPSVDL